MTRMRTPGKASRILTALLWTAGWCALILLDLQTKAAAVRALQGKPPIILVNGVLELLYVQNTGAAFSLLENAQWLFILIAVAAVLLISVFLIRLPKTKRYQPLHILLTFISAGAVGNLIDRIQLGYVRDFIYFSIIDFPVFNVADIYVTASTALLVILVLFYYREEDFHDFRLFHRK